MDLPDLMAAYPQVTPWNLGDFGSPLLHLMLVRIGRR